MIKWTEIAAKASIQRYECLSAFLKDQGIENQFVPIECTVDTFSEVLKDSMRIYDQIRVGSPFGERVPEQVSAIPFETITLKSADCLIRSGSHWWARSMLAEGIVREVALLKKIDISDTAFIVGAGSSCRAVISALLKMGFKKFNITEKYEERGRLLLQDLKTSYFGVDFRFTQQSAVTQLPGIHSLVINTTPLVDTNDLLNELYYCNFLKPDAVVIDLTLVPYETPLIKAALQVGARIVHGCEVASIVDMYWVKSALGVDISPEAYSDCLKKMAQESPFDFTGFEVPDF